MNLHDKSLCYKLLIVETTASGHCCEAAQITPTYSIQYIITEKIKTYTSPFIQLYIEVQVETSSC